MITADNYYSLIFYNAGLSGGELCSLFFELRALSLIHSVSINKKFIFISVQNLSDLSTIRSNTNAMQDKTKLVKVAIKIGVNIISLKNFKNIVINPSNSSYNFLKNSLFLLKSRINNSPFLKIKWLVNAYYKPIG